MPVKNKTKILFDPLAPLVITFKDIQFNIKGMSMINSELTLLH